MIVGRRWKLPDVMHYVGLPLVLLFAWDVAVALLYVELNVTWLAVQDLPMPLAGSALALLLTLRNNNAYARWWEGRTLMGGVVNNCRTLARQIRLHLPGHRDARVLTDLVIAYAQALRCHLRRQEVWNEIAHLTPADLRGRLERSSNVPDSLLAELADRFAGLHRTGALDAVQLAALDSTMAALGNMQGGAERIKNTPLPRQYTFFPRVFVQLFCILLPLALVHDLRLLTPLGSTLIGFIFLALDRVGADLENPFENLVYDVPLTSITRTIEINLREVSGAAEVPEPVTPRDGVLW